MKWLLIMPELPMPDAAFLSCANAVDGDVMQQAPPGPRHVFVYGTLRRGSVRDINRLSPAPRFVGWARVAGCLFHLGSYPGLLLQGRDAVGSDQEEGNHERSQGNWVLGEVYAITPALEVLLDEIEEVWPQATGEYAKREGSVQLLSAAPEAGAAWKHAEGTELLRCLLYEIAPARVQGKPRLDSGDWMAP